MLQKTLKRECQDEIGKKEQEYDLKISYRMCVAALLSNFSHKYTDIHGLNKHLNG